MAKLAAVRTTARKAAVADIRRAKRTEEDSALEGIRGIEYGMTFEYKHPKKGSYWVKFAAIIDPKPGESPEDAKIRLQEFVIRTIEEQVSELKS